MSEWKEVTPGEALDALHAGTHDVERHTYLGDGEEEMWLGVHPSEDHWRKDQKHRSRRKQEYRDVRLPLGVKEAPEIGSRIFFLNEHHKNGYGETFFKNVEDQLHGLSRRAIYTHEATVKKAVIAMGWGTE